MRRVRSFFHRRFHRAFLRYRPPEASCRTFSQVVRTNLPDTQSDAAATVRAYNGFAVVERTFRSMKTVDEKEPPPNRERRRLSFHPDRPAGPGRGSTTQHTAMRNVTAP